ncbi:MAG: bifunctional riboflavin kinase/FAD synthetase [Hyphomonadaceae bacterium]
MRLITGAEPLPEPLRGAAFALGVMDGVHAGHQAVLESARQAARARNAPLAAAVFEPHPRHFFQPDSTPFRLQTSAQRAAAFAALGVDAVVEMTFDAGLAHMPHEAFARDILAGRLGAKHVSVGFDFHFGLGRAGNHATLAADGAALGFSVSTVEAVLQDGLKISSTAIRRLLAEGKPREAATLLTRPWAIEGEVITGAQRGRTINFPTANIALGVYQRPLFGVYAVQAELGGRAVAGVANCGMKPTVGSVAPLLEAHFFDFDGDLYGRRIEVQFIDFIRAERKFESFEALKAQIEADAQTARRLLGF